MRVRTLTRLCGALFLLMCTLWLLSTTIRSGGVFRRPSRFAFVTLMTRDDEDYGKGAIALGRSLRHRFKEREKEYTMICLVTDMVSQPIRDALRSGGGWEIREVSLLPNPSMANPRFSDVYTKLHIFNMTQFDRIVFADADMLVIRPIDELFALTMDEDIGAVADCCDKFNSGLLLVKPSSSLFSLMMSERERISSYDFGEQGFLNTLYKDRWHRLPYRYNAQLPDYMDLPSAWDLDEIKVIHFEKVKPWKVSEESALYAQLEPLLNFWLEVAHEIDVVHLYEGHRE